MRLLGLCLSIILLSSTLAIGAQTPVRELFVTAYGDPNIYSSRSDMLQLIEFSKRSSIKVLFVQIYKANFSWFPSHVGDASAYEAAVKAVGEDPVALLIKEAHHAGIEIHAWVNLLSLGNNQHALLLKKYGVDILTRNLKKKESIQDYKIDGQYFLEPGDLRVRRELSNLIGEILQAYPALDGLQFDYIRYPDIEPHYGYTAMNTDRFKEATGITAIDDAGKEWQQWKRDQVTELLKELVHKARTINPKIQVSTTGCMPYSRALYEAFQDWPIWLNKNIVDFVTVMNYSIDPQEYERWTTQIKSHVRDFNKVSIALGAYKPATSLEIFQKELNICNASGAGACVIFYYSSLLQKPGLTQILQ